MKHTTWLSRALAVTMAAILTLSAAGLSSAGNVYAEDEAQNKTQAAEIPAETELLVETEAVNVTIQSEHDLM